MPPLITTPLTDDLFRGAIELERAGEVVIPHRLPAWAWAQCPDPQLNMAESQPSGIRLVFTTAATEIELETIPTKIVYVGAPARPDGVYDLLIDGALASQSTATGGRTLSVDMAAGTFTPADGPNAVVRFDDLPGQDKLVEIWLPHNEVTHLVALRSDAPARPAARPDRPVWLHHGSSISHGSNAEHPTGIWPAIAAAHAGVELINLGFGGSALLDPFTARTIRDTPADLISLKLGINIVNADLMRFRALGPAVHGFLDTIRDGQPETPILVVSSIYCPIQEDTPGPGAVDLSRAAEGVVTFAATGDPADVAAGRLTLRIIREALAGVVAQRAVADPHLYYLDGLRLYGPEDEVDLPLPDGLHPDATTHQLIGERFARIALSHGSWRPDLRP